ncbi:S-layer homology domain-containing protein [Paenibacillus sp. TRM 82003]|nr:S-layer homology domain-containing protein [Paenibacillus sp. TRM 82003]
MDILRRKLFAAFIMAILLCLPNIAPNRVEAANLTSSMDVSFTSTNQIFQNGEWPSETNGQAHKVGIIEGGSEESYTALQFNLTNAPATINEAKLRIYVPGGAVVGAPVKIHVLGMDNDQWTEALPLDPRGTHSFTVSQDVTSGGNKEFDVTAFIQAQKNIDGIATLLIKGDDSVYNDSWIGLQNAQEDYPPKLIVSGPPPAMVTAVTVPANGTYAEGGSLDFTVNFNEPVTVTGTPELSLNVGGDSSKKAIYLSGSGSSALVFRYVVAPNDSDLDGIALQWLSTAGGAMKGSSGIDANLTLRNVPATGGIRVDALPPRILEVSAPAGTYKAGDTVTVSVRFSEDVSNTGNVQLELQVGNNTRQLSLSGGNDSSVHSYQYTVQPGEVDTNGIEVRGLILNDGSARDGGGNPLSLDLGEAGDFPQIIVDGAQPYVLSATVPDAGTYKIGQALDFTVSFNEAVTVTGIPQLGIAIGPVAENASYVSGNGSATLAFRYIVKASDLDGDGIAVNGLTLNGGTIKDAAGNNAELLVPPVDSTLVLVDGTFPAVTSVSVPQGGTYIAGSEMRFTVHFTENVNVTDSPRLELMIGATSVYASYVSGSGGNAIDFRYAVEAGKLDSDGITLHSLTMNGGTIMDEAGNAANLTLNNVGNTSAVLVDSLGPSVVSVALPATGTYSAGAAIDFTVAFSEAAIVAGNPQLGVRVGQQEVNAVYVSGSETENLLFRYTVQAGDTDHDGIEVTGLKLNGGTLRDSGGNPAGLALHGVLSSSLLVDAVAPQVQSVEILENKTYTTGDRVFFNVHFTEPVYFSAPIMAFEVTVGSKIREAVMWDVIDNDTLMFCYTVSPGDEDLNGVELGSMFQLNGATIEDIGHNLLENVFRNVGSSQGILVDTTEPRIVQVLVPADGWYTADSSLEFTVRYSEPVEVQGAVVLPLMLFGGTAEASYTAGSGTTDLLFRYTVRPGNTDMDGIELQNLTAAPGSSIKDAVGLAASGVLQQVMPTAGIKIDTTAPSVPTVILAENTKFNSSSLSITGTGEVGTTVTLAIYQANQEVASRTGSAGIGTWSISFTGLSEGLYEAKAYAEDAAGNRSAETVAIPFSVDVTAPPAPGLRPSQIGWTNQTVTVEVYGEAEGRLEYRIGEQGGWTLYTSPVALDSEGIYSFEAKQLDAADNASETASMTLRIDKSKPVIALNGLGSMEMYVGSDYIEPGATVTDNYAAGLEAVVTGAVNPGEVGIYTLRYHAVDPAGNTAVEAVRTVKVIPRPMGLSFNVAAYFVKEGAAAPYSLVQTFSDGHTLDVTASAEYSAAPGLHVDVSTKGMINGIRHGSSVVTAVYGSLTATAQVFVEPVLSSLSWNVPSVSMETGDNRTLQLNANYTDGTSVDVTVQAVYLFAPAGPARLDPGGKLVGLSAGTTQLQATFGGATAQLAVTISEPSTDAGSPAQPTAPVRTVDVQAGEKSNAVKVVVVRRQTEDGQIDQVDLNAAKAEEAIRQAVTSSSGTIKIIVDDLLEDPADTVLVNVPMEALGMLSSKAMSLEIETEHALISIPQESIQGNGADSNLFFRVVPIRKEEEQQVVKERVVNAAEIRMVTGANGETAEAVGMPMTIETNLANQPVEVTFPLDGNIIPADSGQREAFLASLGVYIEHSDGEKVLQTGEIIYGANGQPTGIRIRINKFSTFTIVSIPQQMLKHEPYMNGYLDGTFRPDHGVTRAELAVMLSRLIPGDSDKHVFGTPFPDVPANHWASAAIDQARSGQLLNGYPDGTYQPDKAITRAEMIWIVAASLQVDIVPENNDSLYTDMAGHWAAGAARVLHERELITGFEDGSFRPNATLTRAEAVTMLNRLFNRGPLHKVPAGSWRDVPVTHWAFKDIEEASRDHSAVRFSSGRGESFLNEAGFHE